ncbi:hypothetical protein, partial [uncultured Mitsuokella sp.]|uniref:hypothetical protein n=1 Tax=uncultured Mitsuokella sp. TaxID=453120 RepID=UPI0026759D54
MERIRRRAAGYIESAFSDGYFVVKVRGSVDFQRLFHLDRVFERRLAVDRQSRICIFLAKGGVAIYRCIAANAQVFHHIGIVHNRFTSGNGIAGNGGLCDSASFNGSAVCLVFKGGTIGITGYGVIASQISNLSGSISNFSICKVQDVTGHFVQDIFRLVVNGAAFRRIGDTIGSHFTLHCRTVSNLGGYGFTGLIGNGFCLIGQRFCSFVVNILRSEAAVTGYGRGLFSAYRGAQVSFVVFRHITSYRFRQGSFHGIALVAINRSALAAISFRHSSFDAFRLASAYRILLIASYDIGLVSAYRSPLVCLDVGDLGIEVFSFCSLHIDCPVFRYRNRLVSSYRMGFISAHLGIQVGLVVFGDFASDSGLHFAADSGGHVFRSVVDDILSIIGDGALLGGVGDIFCRLGDASAVGAIR